MTPRLCSSEALEHYQLALAIDADFTLAEFNSGLTYQVTTGVDDPMTKHHLQPRQMYNDTVSTCLAVTTS